MSRPFNFSARSASQDSAISCNAGSQYVQDSQSNGLSQIATQDVFTQNNSQEVNQPPRRLSLYENWKYRQSLREDATLTTPGPQDTQILGGAPGQRCMSAPLSARGALPDDRWNRTSAFSVRTPSVPVPKVAESDLMNNVINCMDSCRDEMTTGLCSITDRLEKDSKMSKEELQQTIASFLDKIWRHECELRALLEETDKKWTANKDVERKLAQRETTIAMLEKQILELKESSEEKDDESVKETLHASFQDLRKLLEEMLEVTKRLQRSQDGLRKDLNSIVDSRLNKRDSRDRELKRMENSLMSEIKTMKSVLETKQAAFQANRREDLKSLLTDRLDELADRIDSLAQGFATRMSTEEGHKIETAIQNSFKPLAKTVESLMKTKNQENGNFVAKMQSTLEEFRTNITNFSLANHRSGNFSPKFSKLEKDLEEVKRVITEKIRPCLSEAVAVPHPSLHVCQQNAVQPFQLKQATTAGSMTFCSRSHVSADDRRNTPENKEKIVSNSFLGNDYVVEPARKKRPVCSERQNFSIAGEKTPHHSPLLMDRRTESRQSYIMAGVDPFVEDSRLANPSRPYKSPFQPRSLTGPSPCAAVFPQRQEQRGDPELRPRKQPRLEMAPAKYQVDLQRTRAPQQKKNKTVVKPFSYSPPVLRNRRAGNRNSAPQTASPCKSSSFPFCSPESIMEGEDDFTVEDECTAFEKEKENRAVWSRKPAAGINPDRSPSHRGGPRVKSDLQPPRLPAKWVFTTKNSSSDDSIDGQGFQLFETSKNWTRQMKASQPDPEICAMKVPLRKQRSVVKTPDLRHNSSREVTAAMARGGSSRPQLRPDVFSFEGDDMDVLESLKAHFPCTVPKDKESGRPRGKKNTQVWSGLTVPAQKPTVTPSPDSPASSAVSLDTVISRKVQTPRSTFPRLRSFRHQ